MTKAEFVKELGFRCGLTKEKSMEVFNTFDDMLNEIIATNDIIKFGFGSIEGETHYPIKIKGKVAKCKEIKRNGGWSSCKMGYPKVTWSKDAKYTTKVFPKDWFEYVENRYTDDAKQYRQENGIEEPDLKNEDVTKLQRIPDNIRELYDRYNERVERKEGNSQRARKQFGWDKEEDE